MVLIVLEVYFSKVCFEKFDRHFFTSIPTIGTSLPNDNNVIIRCYAEAPRRRVFLMNIIQVIEASS